MTTLQRQIKTKQLVTRAISEKLREEHMLEVERLSD